MTISEIVSRATKTRLKHGFWEPTVPRSENGDRPDPQRTFSKPWKKNEPIGPDLYFPCKCRRPVRYENLWKQGITIRTIRKVVQPQSKKPKAWPWNWLTP